MGVYSCGGGREDYYDSDEDEVVVGPAMNILALDHGGEGTELVPILVEALAGKKVIGAATGSFHTAAWTQAGELFTFGEGLYGHLSHGGIQNVLVPRLGAGGCLSFAPIGR